MLLRIANCMSFEYFSHANNNTNSIQFTGRNLINCRPTYYLSDPRIEIK